MKFSVNKGTPPARKLVAVIAATKDQYWFISGNRVKFFQGHVCREATLQSLEVILKDWEGRVPVYEGDSITIQF